ncbi:hypothetical protein RHD99_20850 [Buttiauxella selenatireducens]|uniref:Cytoplasmic protein n=1 Tax=Buttiauxella selenatireducens TaxID=3073902 RepID=A0ABY9SH27_9ENTR|nr:hypothetical protein [Buttiauxella sp. R73]WMY76799.1 hypothetical protein RHD99_20850 [Buttiauxella sp. R73]
MATRKSTKKATPSPVAAAAIVTATAESELSYDEMLNELEAIVIDADARLAEEEATL